MKEYCPKCGIEGVEQCLEAYEHDDEGLYDNVIKYICTNYPDCQHKWEVDYALRELLEETEDDELNLDEEYRNIEQEM